MYVPGTIMASHSGQISVPVHHIFFNVPRKTVTPPSVVHELSSAAFEEIGYKG